MTANLPFDCPLATDFTETRQAFSRQLIENLQRQIVLSSALDVGCGVGYFSRLLSELGFRVVGLDGREGNVREARNRHPQIDFRTVNAEELQTEEMGTFDLVLCFGLLYHLENPFRAIRGLYSVTRKVLLVESMCAPGMQPSLQLVDESQAEDQGLNYVAFYPTEACLAKMLYRAGFQYVYGFEALPDHPLFKASLWHRKVRTMLVASKEMLSIPGTKLLPDIKGSWEILATRRERLRERLDRVAAVWRKFRLRTSPR